MAFKAGRSGKDFASRLQKRSKNLKTETQLVASAATRSIQAEYRKRDFPTTRVNKQDAPGGKQLNPGRRKNATVTQTSTSTATVIKLQIQSFWTGARSQAIKNILTTLGLVRILFRDSLIVKKKPKIGPAYYQRLKFSSHPMLARWAAREDKGSQYLRHVLRANGPIINLLVMQPTLNNVVPGLMKSWEKVALENLRGK